MHLHNCRLRLSSPFMNHRASETRRRKPPALINKAGTFYSSANESSRSALLQFLERGKSMTNHLPTHAKSPATAVVAWKKKTSLHLPPSAASIHRYVMKGHFSPQEKNPEDVTSHGSSDLNSEIELIRLASLRQIAFSIGVEIPVDSITARLLLRMKRRKVRKRKATALSCSERRRPGRRSYEL